MRCPDCNKFVAYDTEVDPEPSSEPEIVVTTHGEGGTITRLAKFAVTYTRALPCGECGTDLKTIDLEIEIDLPSILAGPCEPTNDPDGDGEHEWDFDLTATPTTEYEGTGRGTRTFYGVEVEGSATCTKCQTGCTLQGSNRAQASTFDDA